MVKNLPAMQETKVRSQGWEDPQVGKILWEKGMATHSSILAWEIPWTDWLQPMGSKRVGLDTHTSHILNCTRNEENVARSPCIECRVQVRSYRCEDGSPKGNRCVPRTPALPWGTLTMVGMGGRGRAPGRLGAEHPWHSRVHPAPLLTLEKCRGRWGAKHLKGDKGKPGEVGWLSIQCQGAPGTEV